MGLEKFYSNMGIIVGLPLTLVSIMQGLPLQTRQARTWKTDAEIQKHLVSIMQGPPLQTRQDRTWKTDTEIQKHLVSTYPEIIIRYRRISRPNK